MVYVVLGLDKIFGSTGFKFRSELSGRLLFLPAEV
jgi:hypothetical protein